MSISSKFNYIFISFCLLYHPLNVIWGYSQILGSYHLDILLFVFCFTYSIQDRNYKKILTTGPMLVWGVWTLYTIVNWFYIGLNPESLKWYDFIWGKLRIYFLLCSIVYECNKDFERTLKWLLGTFFVYSFFGLFLQGNEMRTDASWEGRNGVALGNHFPLTAVAMFFVTCVMNIKGLLKSKYLYAIAALSVFIILWVATRKAMFAFFILALFYLLTKFDIRSSKNKILLFIAFCLTYGAYSLVMNYTLLGKRTMELNEMEYSIPVPEYLNFLGDRAVQYVLGWNLFIDNPINGIGIYNFMYVTGFPVPFHTEYMVQLAEGGVIGALIFIFYIVSYFKGIKKVYYIDRDTAIMLYGGMAALLFIALTAWLYNTANFYVVYGIIAAECYLYKNKDAEFYE